MGTLNDEEWASLAEKHAGKRLGRVDLVSVGTLVCRAPTRLEYRMFMQQIMDPASQADAHANLFAQTCVYPDPPTVAQMLEGRPGLMSNKKIVVMLNRLNGSEDEEAGKGSSV
jgi:hypothetical protein